MADGNARIKASLEGASQVASEARKIDQALSGAGSNVEKKLGGALKGVGGAIGDVVKGGLSLAGVFQGINLAKAVEDVKRLDSLTAQLSARTGMSSDALQARYARMEQRILASSTAQAEFTKSLGGMTYDAKGAMEALEGLGTHALASGRDLGDELPLGKALKDMGVAGSDTVAELDRVRAIAEKLGTTGGHLALQDSLGRLDGLLQGVQTRTDAARGRLEALLGVLGKGQQTPERADQTRAATLSMLRSRALDIERATGRRVVDDNGNLIDPTQTLKDMRALSEKRHGGRRGEMRNALINTYGMDAGLAIYRGGFEQVDSLAQKAGGPSKTEADAAKARQDDAAKRTAKDLAKQGALRKVGAGLVGIDDKLTGALGTYGALGVEGGASMAALGGGKMALGLAGAPVAGAAIAAGAMVGVAYEQNIKYRDAADEEERARAKARGMGQGAYRDLVATGMVGLPTDAAPFGPGVAAPMPALERGSAQDELAARRGAAGPSAADLREVGKAMAQEMAAELRRQPLVAQMPRDPNQRPAGM